jgi:enterobactin synthetase component D
LLSKNRNETGAGPKGHGPGEVLRDAVPACLAEFHQGRSAARAAMRAIGLPPAGVPVNPDRSPRWPDGLTGSISHCAEACIAVVGRAPNWAGIGIDLEPDIPMDRDLWPAIVSPKEIDLLSDTSPGLGALRLFVAKEAAYKAQYASSGQLIDFHDLFARQAMDDLIQLHFTRPVFPFIEGNSLAVQIFAAEGLVAGLGLIPAE